MTKAEARHSTNVALGVNALPNIQQTVKRVYETLCLKEEWPHLNLKRFKSLSAGQRYYAFPADMDFDRVTGVYIKYAGQWTPKPIPFGITVEHYNSVDSDDDARMDPVRRWGAHEGDMFEVWPMPASNSINSLRLDGQKKFVPLVADSDIVQLDDNLIALYAAAEILAPQKGADAQAKLTQGQVLLTKLLGRQSKERVMYLDQGDDDAERGSHITVHYARAE